MPTMNSYILRFLRLVVTRCRNSQPGYEDACEAGFAARQHVEFRIMLCELHYPPVTYEPNASPGLNGNGQCGRRKHRHVKRGRKARESVEYQLATTQQINALSRSIWGKYSTNRHRKIHLNQLFMLILAPD
jgi:hypothetical protein